MDHMGVDWAGKLHVERGATVVLMADLTKMAWRSRRAGQRFNGAHFLDGFVNAAGPEGTVMVPTYNFDLRNGDKFDVRHTRSISGALAQLALEHAAFQRTGHPLHSFAVAGAATAPLVRTTPLSSFDSHSPFAYQHAHGAVLIGIDLPLDDVLTFTHYVEEQVGVAYRGFKDLWIDYTDRDGSTKRRRFVRYAKKAGHMNRFGPLEQALSAAGALVHVELAGSRVTRVDLSKAYDVIAADIRSNGARGIHEFSWKQWLRETMKGLLRIFGIRTTKERTAHAARTS